MKRQKLIKCVLIGNSKQYLGKAYTVELVNKLRTEKLDKLFSNYKMKLLGQMVKSLGKLIIEMYSTLGMSIQDALIEYLDTGPFLNSTLQRFMCKLYHRFGSFLAPLSIGLITNRHYLSELKIASTKNEGTTGDEERDE